MTIGTSNHLINGGKIIQGEDYKSDEELHGYASLKDK